MSHTVVVLNDSCSFIVSINNVVHFDSISQAPNNTVYSFLRQTRVLCYLRNYKTNKGIFVGHLKGFYILSESKCVWSLTSETAWGRFNTLCLHPASASFWGASEGQLCHNAARRLSQSKGSSKCSFFSLFLEDAPLQSFMASHIPRFFAHLKKKKESEKMTTSRGVDRHFHGPGRQKLWRKGKTSGDATRKCSKG